MRTTPKNAFYAQSGGVSAVINASACGLIETARKHRGRIGKVYAGRRHHRRAHRGHDRHREGVRRDNPRFAPYAGRRLRVGALQTCGNRQEPGPVPAADRSIPRARYRLLLLQRRQRLHGYRAQGVRDRRANGLPDHLHRDSQDRRQRPGDDRLLSGLRLGGQVHRGIDARSGARRRIDGTHLDQSVRARGHGPSRGLDRRRGRPGRRAGRGCAAHHSVPGDRLRPCGVSRQGQGLRRAARLLRHRGLGGRA